MNYPPTDGPFHHKKNNNAAPLNGGVKSEFCTRSFVFSIIFFPGNSSGVICWLKSPLSSLIWPEIFLGFAFAANFFSRKAEISLRVNYPLPSSTKTGPRHVDTTRASFPTKDLVPRDHKKSTGASPKSVVTWRAQGLPDKRQFGLEMCLEGSEDN